MDISLDIGGFIVYTVYAVRKGVRQMKRYTVDFITEGRQKLFYIKDTETLDIALLPSKYLKHKTEANRSPNTVRRIALSLCYYLNYLSQTETELTEVDTSAEQ